MNKRILVVSWFYHPVNSSEGLVTYKLLKASKLEYDVYTQKNNDLWSYGNKDNLPGSDNVKTIFSKAKTLEEWEVEAVEYFKANRDKYDVVMTRSMPPESHKIALEIKKIKPEIIWIASFGDPIAENPYTKMAVTYPSPYGTDACTNILGVLSPKRIIKSILFNIRYKKQQELYLGKERVLQKEILSVADYYIFNSEYQKEYMLGEYGDDVKKKGIVLFHSYDETLYPAKKEPNKKIKMVYIGHLDAYRSPFLIFDAIRDLAAEDPNLADKLEVEFYGHMTDADKLFIVNYELTDIIKVRQPVSYLKSLEIMKNADWVLHIDANLASILERNIFFAAKLADYIGAGTDIFGITMVEGISADILRKMNAVQVSYSRMEVYNYMWLILYKGYRATPNPEYRECFSNVEVARQFDEFVAEITK